MPLRCRKTVAKVAGRLRLLGVDWAEEQHVYNSAAAVAQLLETQHGSAELHVAKLVQPLRVLSVLSISRRDVESPKIGTSMWLVRLLGHGQRLQRLATAGHFYIRAKVSEAVDPIRRESVGLVGHL